MNFIIFPYWRLCSRRLAAITLGRGNCSNLERFIMAFLTEISSNKSLRNDLSIRENLLTRILIRLPHGAIQISKVIRAGFVFSHLVLQNLHS